MYNAHARSLTCVPLCVHSLSLFKASYTWQKLPLHCSTHTQHVYTSPISRDRPRIIPVHPNATQGIPGAGRDDPSIFLG